MNDYRWLAGALVLTLACGCSSDRRTMHVWGEASYAGKAIEEGQIVFFPIDDTKGPSTGGAITAGRYDVPAASGPYANGTYRVEIIGLRKNGRTVVAPGGPVEVMDNVVPGQYNRKSTLKVTISPVAAENQHDFRLEPAGR